MNLSSSDEIISIFVFVFVLFDFGSPEFFRCVKIEKEIRKIAFSAVSRRKILIESKCYTTATKENVVTTKYLTYFLKNAKQYNNNRLMNVSRERNFSILVTNKNLSLFFCVAKNEKVCGFLAIHKFNM